MIKLTNKLGLPEPIVEAMKNDSYTSGNSDYTITGLLKPPRMAVLSKTIDIIEDAGDRLYALQGQIMHTILERAGNGLREEGYVVEKRFKQSYGVNDKIFTVSAQIDLFDPVKSILYDYKYTSVGSSKYGLKEDHRLQLNFQAEMLRKAGFQVDKAEVILIFRDWSAEKAYDGYPPQPFLKQDVQLMSSDEVTSWVKERIRLHEEAKIVLPTCTDEERWANITFAVMKKGASKALRVFSSLQEAESFVNSKELTLETSIVRRVGDSKRCLRYCPARFVCEQAKSYQPTPILDKDGFVKVT